jgi:uncharacterized protein YoxC
VILSLLLFVGYIIVIGLTVRRINRNIAGYKEQVAGLEKEVRDLLTAVEAYIQRTSK